MILLNPDSSDLADDLSFTTQLSRSWPAEEGAQGKYKQIYLVPDGIIDLELPDKLD